MSIFDQKQLLASMHPFDLLSSRALDNVMAQMDIAYYPRETVLVSPNVPAECLYIIIKGSVHEWLGEELTDAYGAMDSFDADALIYGQTDKRFVVDEELICYELPKQIFLDLIQDHDAFKHFYLEDFVTKHEQLKMLKQQNDLTPFMVARIGDIYLHTPCIVAAETPIAEAVRQMEAMKSPAILVEGEEGYGIVTDSDLRRNVLMGAVEASGAIGTIASRPLVTIEKQDFLFNALLLFTAHHIKRVAVTDGGKVVGILEQLDLLSFFASHSYLVAMQVEKADSIEALQRIGEEMVNLIRSLHTKGVKVRYITKLVNALNAKIYRKVFEFCVAPEHRGDCALIVMGSEGRGEQILRTDQDNGLIIRDGCGKDFADEMAAMNAALRRLGFPDCPGNVMVTNPWWRRPLADYQTDIDGWVGSMDEAALQNLDIFLDARCVAGNAELLDRAEQYLYGRFEGRDDVLAHMAKAALSFETPLSLFSGLVVERSHGNTLNLKKGGIFPIVHGIRVLALQKKIRETNTFERIKQLNNAGVFDKTFSTELMEAYDTLLSIRLRARLAHAAEGWMLNDIAPGGLDKLERDLLKDSFKVVNALKKLLTYHFHLNMVM
ncbi:putative nucleotidyltransferase substrate binding domain-containing protein [Sulfurimonas sp. HSL1-6]|uniref:putative nucleotidyltransferase substrate binding domain-containing protein n=1 Tax=Thiomicrolovo immobilis TaxID=3131935 RepID=UPI0031F7D187